MDNSGELFSRVYAERGAPTQDGQRFRVRLFGYIHEANDIGLPDLAVFIRREIGVDIAGNHSGLRTFFNEGPVADILNAITVVVRMLRDKASEERYSGLAQHYGQQAAKWVQFVERVFREENLGYTVNREGGVRYFVDEEFERNRASALSALDAPHLAAVREAFEQAHRYLDPGSRDAKASVRSAFEAMEILAKLMYGDKSKLSKNLVLQQLREDIKAMAADDIAKKAIDSTFRGLGEVVDGAHEYRHGQGVNSPVEPPIDYVLFFISVTAAALRWMVPLWTSKRATASA